MDATTGWGIAGIVATVITTIVGVVVGLWLGSQATKRTQDMWMRAMEAGTRFVGFQRDRKGRPTGGVIVRGYRDVGTRFNLKEPGAAEKARRRLMRV